MKSNRIENLIFLTSSLFLLTLNVDPFIRTLNLMFYPFSSRQDQYISRNFTLYSLGIYILLAFIYFVITYFYNTKKPFNMFLKIFKSSLLYLPIISFLLSIPVDPNFETFQFLSYVLFIVFIGLLTFDIVNFLLNCKFAKTSFLINILKQIILLLLIIYLFTNFNFEYYEIEILHNYEINHYAMTCVLASFYFISFLIFLGYSLYKLTDLNQFTNEVPQWKKYTLHPYIWFYYQFIHS